MKNKMITLRLSEDDFFTLKTVAFFEAENNISKWVRNQSLTNLKELKRKNDGLNPTNKRIRN